LAVFKPASINDFKIEPVDRQWDKDKLDRLQLMNLFETAKDEKFEVVRKLPYKFSFSLTDNQGTASTMMIEDWEIGQLYWNCLSRHDGNEDKACTDVKNKYFNDFAKTKDMYLFLGTTQLHHHVSHNPFMIIGTFTPSMEEPKPQ
jgi:hypothetical protein